MLVLPFRDVTCMAASGRFSNYQFCDAKFVLVSGLLLPIIGVYSKAVESEKAPQPNRTEMRETVLLSVTMHDYTIVVQTS